MAFFASAPSAVASQAPSEKNRCHFIGVSNWHYFVLVTKHINPGRHHDYVQEISLHQYKIRDNTLIKTYPLRQTKYKDKAGNNVFVRAEVKGNYENLHSILVKHRVSYIFPWHSEDEKPTFIHNASGIYLKGKRKSVLLLPKAKLPELSDAYSSAEVVDVFYTGNSYFLLLRWLNNCYGMRETVKCISVHSVAAAAIKAN